MADTVQLQLPSGPITAVQKDNLVYAYGLRYGTAKRFHRSEAPAPWTSPQDCTQKGPVCPQQKFAFGHVLGKVAEDGRPHDEDCLRVSVVAPADAVSQGKKLPVVVWFHGGAYLFGAGDLNIFGTDELAKLGVVTVSVTYRLGLLGYQPIPGLVPANLALLDQVLALQWVHSNIAAFGGDSANITLIGQSAGADSVFCLTLADGAADLIKRTIIVSCPFGLKLNRTAMNDMLTKKAQERITKDNIDQLTLDQVIAIQDEMRNMAKLSRQGGLPFAPYWGEYPLPPESEVEQRFVESTRTKSVLLMWTRDEATPFMQLTPIVDKIITLPLIGGPFRSFAASIGTARVWVKPAEALRDKVLKAGGQCASFSFDWFPALNVLRAAHCIDMPFYLGNWSLWKSAPLVGGTDAEEVIARVGGEIKQLFVDFAKGVTRPTGHYSIGQDFTAQGVKQIEVEKAAS